MYRSIWRARDYALTSVYPGLNLPECIRGEHILNEDASFVVHVWYTTLKPNTLDRKRQEYL